MRNQPFFMKTVASLLTVTMSVLPIHAYANNNQNPDISSVGKEAQSFGKELANSFRTNSGSVQNGAIAIPTLKDGQFQINGGSQIHVNDLFPGTSSANNQPDSYYFPDANKPDVESLKGIFDSGDGMDSVGNNAKGSLWIDANSSNPSISGAAYKVLLDAANRSRPDFTNDPLLNLSKKTYEDIDLISEGFGDCSASTVLNPGTINTHIPEYERCNRVVKTNAECEIMHSFGISSFVENIYVASQGRTWITVQFDLKDGSWRHIHPSDGEIKIAKIPVVDFSAMCQDAINTNTKLIGSWDWPDHGIPGQTDSTVIYRVIENPTCHNGLVGTVQIQDSREDDDIEWILAGHFSFSFVKQTEDKWETQSCIEQALSLNDGFCSGSITVIDGATNEQDCINVNGVNICPNDSLYKTLKPSPIHGVPTLAKKIRVSDLQCNFNVGEMDCWTDPQGVEHCPYNEGNHNLNSCSALESNNQCGFISSTCVDGAKGASGKCYVHEDTYDCGISVEVPTVEKETTYQCGGPIRCMGDDCLDLSKSQSTDFARATALLNAAQFMTQDMSCTDSASEEGGDENIEQGCTAFGGKPGECKIAVGGVSDCCEKPSNISLADYLNLIMAVPKLDGAIMAFGSEANPSAIKGAYQILREPALEGWTEVTKPFASYIENVSGTVDTFFQPVEQFVDELIDQLTEQVKEVMADVMKSLGQDAATQEAAAGGAGKLAQESLMESAATWLSTAMTIYTVYVVAMVMIQMIWKCEEDEFTMNAKRALKNCSYVGSYCKSKVLGACIEKREAYCCFNSPLSRIIQEQVRPQLGQSFGDPKNPQCGGIPLDKIAEIDWSKVNLDEWLGILQQNGKFPDPSSLNLDSLTGAGSDFNIDGSRKNAQERTLERLNGVDVDKARRDLASEIFPDWDGSN